MNLASNRLIRATRSGRLVVADGSLPALPTLESLKLYREYALDYGGPNLMLINDGSSREAAERTAERFPGATLKTRLVSEWTDPEEKDAR